MALTAQQKRQLRRAVQNAGNNLSANEAQQIADQFGISTTRVANTAERNDVNVRPQVYGGINNTTPSSSTESDTAGDQGFDWLSYLDSKTKNDNQFLADLSEGFAGSLESIIGQFGQTLVGLQSNESADRARQAEEQKKRDEEARQSAIDEQLQGLRSGSTVGGTPGSGMDGAGSLASGQASYQRSFNSALSNYRRGLDPTESVLDRKPDIEAVRRERRRDRDEGERRALAGGTSGSDYYARRFG